MRDKDSMLLESAYYQILEEGRRERYMEMFKGMPERVYNYYRKKGPSGFEKLGRILKNVENFEGEKSIAEEINHIIDWAIKTLKREDRIMWFLRTVKAILYTDTSEEIDRFSELMKAGKLRETLGDKESINAEWNKAVPTWLQKTPAHNEIMHRKLALYDLIAFINELEQELIHFLSLGIPQIDNFRFEDQKWEDVKRDFRQYEKEWAEKQKQWINVTDELREGKIEPVVVFDDDFRWFNLKRYGSQEEGKAMGHCGNCGGRTTDTILSLRKLKKEAGRIWARPSLTFILHKDGSLGEMKGRGNNKPQEKYHPYILSLLRAKVGGEYLVKSIEGGGYLPENNFSLTDLSSKDLESLLRERPELLSSISPDFFDNFIKSGNISPFIMEIILQSPKNVRIYGIRSLQLRKGILPDNMIDALMQDEGEAKRYLRRIVEEPIDPKTYPEKLYKLLIKTPDAAKRAFSIHIKGDPDDPLIDYLLDSIPEVNRRDRVEMATWMLDLFTRTEAKKVPQKVWDYIFDNTNIADSFDLSSIFSSINAYLMKDVRNGSWVEKEIPEKLMKRLVYFNVDQLYEMSRHLIARGVNIPEDALEKMSKNTLVCLNLAQWHLIHGLQIPEILLKTIADIEPSNRYYTNKLNLVRLHVDNDIPVPRILRMTLRSKELENLGLSIGTFVR
jgi:hypothetical protein